MLSSISPLGERARQARWWRTTSFYIAGSVAGGAGVGASVGGLGQLVGQRTPLLMVVGFAAAVGAVADIVRRVPTVRRQVDETWLTTYRDWVYGGGYGLQLGAGMTTIVTSAATYLVWLLELATGRWTSGLVIGAVFGAARALPLLSVARVNDPVTLRRRHGELVAALPAVRRAAIAGQVATALALVAVVGTVT